MSKEELKILIYRLCDTLEYEYTIAHNIAWNNWQLSCETESDDLEMRLLILFASQKEKEVVKKVCADICRILDNDR